MRHNQRCVLVGIGLMLVIALVAIVLWNPNTKLKIHVHDVTNPASNFKESELTTIQGKVYPKIDLMVRVSTENTVGKKLEERFICMVMRSVTLFWSPLYGDTIVVIMDNESVSDRAFEQKLLRQNYGPIKPIVKYEPLPKNPERLAACPDPNHRDLGYKRQLYSSFFMDMYATAPIVGWVDSDVVFISPVTEDDIFDDGRLKAMGLSSRMKYGWVKAWFHTVEVAIGFPAVGDFMTYFPTYIWADTFRNFRKFAMKRFNTDTFDEAFYEIYENNIISPINILYNYAWYFERERYFWHLDIEDKAFLKYYNRLHKHVLNVMPRDLTRKVQHAMHHDINRGIENHAAIIVTGYCQTLLHTWGLVDSRHHGVCNRFVNQTHWDMLDYIRETWCSGGNEQKCIRMIEDHYSKVFEYIKIGIIPFKVTHLRIVEKAAEALNIKCPKIDI